MKKHIPNLLTSLNLFSGCIAIVMAFHGLYYWVLIWVLIAAIFDFFDGFAARILNAHSPIGGDLDSLADIVSFGVAPAVAVFSLLKAKMFWLSYNELVVEYLPYAAFILAVFSAIRLAKFNVDTRQSESFIGLNTPTNALFWVSFTCGLMTNESVVFSRGLVVTILIGLIVFSILMVSELKMFSLKVKSWGFKGNEHRYFLTIFSLGLVAYVGVLGIAAGVLMYIALSLIDNQKQSAKNT